jgi:hypothetical protein
MRWSVRSDQNKNSDQIAQNLENYGLTLGSTRLSFCKILIAKDLV